MAQPFLAVLFSPLWEQNIPSATTFPARHSPTAHHFNPTFPGLRQNVLSSRSKRIFCAPHASSGRALKLVGKLPAAYSLVRPHGSACQVTYNSIMNAVAGVDTNKERVR